MVDGRLPTPPGEELARVAAWCRDTGHEPDQYGEGPVVTALQGRVAELLGMEAALLFPSGTMAQALAMRLWAERGGTRRIGLHPTSHLELHEERGYSHVHGLSATLLGAWRRPLLAADLETADGIAPLAVELPLREAGGVLPSWDELQELKRAAHTRGIRLHMDGARLWESAPFYAPRTHADLCAGFDSVYVSLYKGIGALGGAVLAGPRDLIAEARVWRRRLGGSLVHLYPLAASAMMRLDVKLALMPAFHARAVSLAAALAAVEGLRVHPSPPHANLLHLTLPAPPAAVRDARDRVAMRRGVWILGYVADADEAGCSRTELHVLEGALALTDEAVAAGYRELIELVGAGG